MERTEFTKDDSLIIKGLAILAIMLHNFFRWVEPTTGENEFGFAAHTVHRFIEQLTAQPQDFINIIFSYLGHFGVQLFILISGYGLTKSMLSKPQCWTAFMGNRLKKIYPLLIVAILGFIVANFLINNRLPSGFEWHEIGLKLLFFHTLTPNEGLSVCGPWWFFGLIVQLYALFPVLLNLTQRYGTKILAGTALLSYIWILTAIFCYDHPGDDLLAMQNAPGHLPEFCFGIWLALRRDTCLSRWWLIPALAVFILGNFLRPFYPFTFLAVSVIFVIGYNDAKGFIKQHLFLERPLTFVGSVSMFLFAVHGFLRQPFLNIANTYNNAAVSLLTAIAFLAGSIAAALIVKPLYKLLVRLLDKISAPARLLKADKYIMGCTLLLIAFVGYHHATLPFSHKNIEITQNQHNKKVRHMTENSITADMQYLNMAQIKLGMTNLMKVSVDLEIDSQGTPSDQLPLLVFDITGIFWDKCCMPETDGFLPVHYETTIICPIFAHFVPKTLKLYFWNINGTTMRYRNAKISITY